MDSTPRKVVLVIDASTHEMAKAAFSRIKAVVTSLGCVVVSCAIAQAFRHMASEAKRAAELAARIHGNVLFVVDDLPWPTMPSPCEQSELVKAIRMLHSPWPAEFEQQQSADLAKLARALREIDEDAAPCQSGVTNAEQRQRMSDMLHASAKPQSPWLAGFAARPVPRQRQGNRHT